MVSKIEVSLELVRLTQRRANRFNLPFRKQVARCVVEQAILELDPELNFIVDNEASLAEVDVLAQALKVNDIVVNGRHIDVALLDGGEVLLHNALVDTPYLECGSLIVQLDGANRGSVVGYVDGTSWNMIADMEKSPDVVSIPFSPKANFDLAECLQRIEKYHAPNVDSPLAELPKAEDYLQFSRDRKSMSIEKQRQVVAAAVSSAAVRKNIGLLDANQGSKVDPAQRVLRDSAVWEVRILGVVEKVHAKFPHLSVDQIVEAVRQVGAQQGGQPEAPEFKESLLKVLARQQLAAKFSPDVKAIMNTFVDKLLAGKNKAEAISDYVKNKAAVDVARIIGEKREAARQFAAASAEEIGFAFKQLALQPAYATHSASENTGVAAINEALQLFEAADLVEDFMELDF
ncbi:MAG TPA: hypothetical protein V6C86_18820 [Oculatellaceae cyanobacterium]